MKKIPIAALFLAIAIMALAVAAFDMSGGSIQACDEGKSVALVRSDASAPGQVASVAPSNEYLVQGNI